MALSICIDPGHGGYDPGCSGNGLVEKTVNLYVAQHLRDLLEHAGINVTMTRDDDVCPAGDTTNVTEDLQARCDISDSAGVDYFLSIHFNAGGGVGSESYCCPGGQANVVAPAIVDATASIFGYHGEKVKDGGANGANLYVLKHTAAHAVLIEVAFLDSSDAQKVKDHIDEVAPNLAQALIPILGGSVDVETPVPSAPTTPIVPVAQTVDMTGYATMSQVQELLAGYVTSSQLSSALSTLKDEATTQTLAKLKQDLGN